MSWGSFAGIFALFLITHSIPVQPANKARIVATTGSKGFSIGYSILSIGMLSLLIWAAGEAPVVALWPQSAWHRHVVHVGMLLVCLIFAFSVARPNPFSFGGHQNDALDPKRPGIIRLMRHPMLVAMSLWATLHMLANGDLAHVLLFGVLGGFALFGRNIINTRKQRALGTVEWNGLNATVRKAPYITPPRSWVGVVCRIIAASLVFVVLLLLHPVVIGVAAN